MLQSPPYMTEDDIGSYIEFMCKELASMAEIAGMPALVYTLQSAEKIAGLDRNKLKSISDHKA